MIDNHRIVKVFHDELVLDRQACSEMINTACGRSCPLQVTGLLSGDDFLLLTLEESGPHRRKYHFVPLEGDSAEELSAELTARFFAGFTMIGGFRLRDRHWALLSEEAK